MEETKEAAELHAIYRDLQFVVHTAEHLMDHIESEEEQEERPDGVRIVPFSNPSGEPDVVRQSLWVAALVTYVRCFTSGKRVKLDESIFDEQWEQYEEIVGWHRYFKDMRDKHMAHSVNPFEEFYAGLHVTDLQGNPEVKSLYTFWSNFVGEPVYVLENLRAVADYARQLVQHRLQGALSRAFRKAKTLPPEQLRGLKPLEFKNHHGFDAARTPRT